MAHRPDCAGGSLPRAPASKLPLTEARTMDIVADPAPIAVLRFHPPVMDTLPAVDPALLLARPRGLMVEYTSRCNLRCRYCSKANPGDDEIPGRDMDMTEQTLEQVLQLISQQKLSELLLAGTGESTFHKQWVRDLPRLIAAGKAANPQCWVHINTNLALRYGDAEFAVLAQLDGLVISIDTADRELTRTVRAKSDLALIAYNMLALKAWCEARGQRVPKMSVNATCYADAGRGMHELVVFLAQLPVDRVALSDLVELEACRVNGLRALNIDDRAAFVESVQSLQKAIHFAQTSKRFQLDVQPHLIERVNALVARFNAGGAEPVVDPAELAPRAATKLCLQPWTRFTVAADGALFPCCVTDMPAVGHIARDGEGVNGPAIQRFRQRLLVGDLPTACVDCSNARGAHPAELQAAVAAVLRGPP